MRLPQSPRLLFRFSLYPPFLKPDFEIAQVFLFLGYTVSNSCEGRTKVL